MTIQQQQYYYMQRQRQNTLNAYARQMMAAQGAGGSEEKTKIHFTPQTIVKYKDGSIIEYDIQGEFNYNSISDRANVVEIKLGTDITNIKNRAFSGWSELTCIMIPDTIVDFNDEVERCSKMTSYIVDENNPAYKSVDGMLLTKDGKTLVRGINGNIVIPNGVETIGKYAFANLYNLTSVSIPNSVTVCDMAAFDYCSGLKKVNIANLSKWCRIEFKSGVYANPLYYAHNLYVNGQLLTQLEIPNDIVNINDRAFTGCTCLTSVVIPNNVVSIGYSAFDNCSNLSNITIGNGVANIKNFAFHICNNITQFIVDENNPAYKSVDGMLLTKDGKTLIQGINNISIIPEDVVTINRYAFSKCNVTNITIPDSVTNIGDSAFDNCINLTAITIGTGITNIGNSAFSQCSNLSSITCNAMTAPTIQSYTFGPDYLDIWLTGYNTSSQGINRLYIPTGATGYDLGTWLDPLQNPDKCGFTIEYI